MFYIFLILLIISLILLCYTLKDNFSNIPRWSEINRNKKFFSSKSINYPPCFEKSRDAQEIYNIITKSQNLYKYYGLFNTLSVILCQLNNKNGFLKDRINNLIVNGGAKNKESEYIVNKFKISNEDIKKFLILATSLLEYHITISQKENEINKEDKEKIKKLINNFYNEIYSKF